jgi:fucose permease
MYLIVLLCSLLPLISGFAGRFAARADNRQKAGVRAFLKLPLAWPVIWALSLSLVCEMGIGGWLVNFLEKAYAFDSESGALVLSAFFACFTVARLVLGPLTDKFGFVRSLLLLSAFSGLAVVAGTVAGRPGVALLVVSGIGIAPLYPTLLAAVAKLFADEIYAAMTVVLTAMGIISMISNLVLGILIDGARRIFTSLYGASGIGMAYAAGIIFLGLCCLFAFAAVAVLGHRLKREGRMV